MPRENSNNSKTNVKQDKNKTFEATENLTFSGKNQNSQHNNLNSASEINNTNNFEIQGQNKSSSNFNIGTGGDFNILSKQNSIQSINNNLISSDSFNLSGNNNINKNLVSSGSIKFSQSVINESIPSGVKAQENSMNSNSAKNSGQENDMGSTFSNIGKDGSNLNDKKLMERNIQINHDLPNLSGVKSKIDTGLRMNREVKKEAGNEDLAKKFTQVQKENQDKLKEYRDMILKMKKDKRSNPKDVKIIINFF